MNTRELKEDPSYIIDNMFQALKSGNLHKYSELRARIDDELFKALINERDRFNNTLLICAARKGYLEIVDDLIQLGADKKLADNNGFNYVENLSFYMIESVKQKKYDNIKAALEVKGIPLTMRYPHQGSYKGITVESALFDAMIDALQLVDLTAYVQLRSLIPNEIFRIFINRTDTHGDTLLNWAAYQGHLEMAKEFLELGADPRIRDDRGNDFLKNLSFFLVKTVKERKYDQLTSILKFEGIPLTTPHPSKYNNITAETALFDGMVEALQANNFATFAQLRSSVPDGVLKTFINKKDQYDNTMLNWAAYKGHLGFVKELIKLDADPTIRSKDGYDFLGNLSLFLIRAIKAKEYHNIKSVLEFKGVSLTVCDDDRCTAEFLLFAQMIELLQANDVKAYEQLKSAIPDELFNTFINKKNQQGHTLLDVAAAKANLDVMNALLKRGADPFIAMVAALRAKNQKAFEQLTFVIPSELLKTLINKKDDLGDTFMSIASEQNDQKIMVWLYENGADYRDDYQSKNHDFYKLTKNGFASALEVKPATITSVYQKDEKIISQYAKRDVETDSHTFLSHFKKASEHELFKNQFTTLMDLYTQWGKKNRCLDKDSVKGIESIKKNLFLTDNKQPNQYFEFIKSHLEKIFIILKNKSISLEKRTQEYTRLCNHFTLSGYDLVKFIEDTYQRLDSNQSVEKWVGQLRTNIIKIYADRYNVEKKISAEQSINTSNAFTTYAAKQGWNPLVPSANMQNTLCIGMTEGDFIKFHSYFVRNYDFTAIRNCVYLNLNALLSQISKDEFGYALNGWNIIKGDYQPLLRRISNVMEALGVKLTYDEVCHLSEDQTQFLIDINYMVSKLCEKVLPCNLYYEFVKKQYVELFPRQWLDGQDVKAFDFSIWEQIPEKHVAAILLGVIKQIPDQYVSILLSNMPKMVLADIIKQPQFYDFCLKTIGNQTYDNIKELIAEALSISVLPSSAVIVEGRSLGYVGKEVENEVKINPKEIISPVGTELSLIELAKARSHAYEMDRENLLKQLDFLENHYKMNNGEEAEQTKFCRLLIGKLHREEFDFTLVSIVQEYKTENIFYNSNLFSKEKSKLGRFFDGEFTHFITQMTNTEKELKKRITDAISDLNDKQEQELLVKKLISDLPEKYRTLPREVLQEILVKEIALEEEQRKVEALFHPSIKQENSHRFSSAKHATLFVPVSKNETAGEKLEKTRKSAILLG